VAEWLRLLTSNALPLSCDFGGSTQVPVCALNNVQKGTLCLPLPLKLEKWSYDRYGVGAALNQT
jgi:hypothetical protein